ncbi:MAG: GntR family transcriptional regulator [Candidatus Methylomirabilales bacterium]
MAIPGRKPTPPPPAPALGRAPVAYRTIAEQVAGRLRAAIAQGRLRPAARLLEAPLARQMGTSRAPVREALAALEREGLVVKEPNRGARVVELTPETIREVASLRAALEGFAAALAADRLSPADLAALDGMLARMERAAGRGQFSRLLELDFEFHERICRASGHRMLYEIWSGMERKVRLFLSATNLLYTDLRGIVRGHAGILDALRRRDGAAAQQAMARHLGERLGHPGAPAAAAGRRRPRPADGASALAASPRSGARAGRPELRVPRRATV